MSGYAERARGPWHWRTLLCVFSLRECPGCRWWRETGKP